jgi:hypothetical protein
MSPTTPTTPHTWTITTTEGITLTGHQPDWSNQALGYLREHAHYTMLPIDPALPPATLDIQINGTRHRQSTSLMFATQIACRPYSPQPPKQVPTASRTIIEDWDIEDLTPTDLARIATQIRTQADYFENTALP